MPKKDSKYATVDIDLKQWLEDYMAANGINKLRVAQVLDVNRGRITEMANGRLNTMMFVELITEKIYKGKGYEHMAKYALTDAGLEILKDLDWKRKNTPHKRALHRQIDQAVKQLLEKKDYSSVGDILKDVQKTIK